MLPKAERLYGEGDIASKVSRRKHVPGQSAPEPSAAPSRVQKPTHLLRDDPATEDEFGTHGDIASLIRDEILHSEEGRSLAVVGDWGSGKSTVVRLLRRLEQEKDHSAHVFIYDAWAHQGDPLRRAFLDDLTQFL